MTSDDPELPETESLLGRILELERNEDARMTFLESSPRTVDSI